MDFKMSEQHPVIQESSKYPNSMKLFNSEELSRVLGISPPTVTWWIQREVFPEPFATAGKGDFPLWTWAQVLECGRIYEENRKNITGKYKKRNRTKFQPKFEIVVEVETVEDTFTTEDGREAKYCTCGALYFDFDVHNKYSHQGKLNG